MSSPALFCGLLAVLALSYAADLEIKPNMDARVRSLQAEIAELRFLLQEVQSSVTPVEEEEAAIAPPPVVTNVQVEAKSFDTLHHHNRQLQQTVNKSSDALTFQVQTRAACLRFLVPLALSVACAAVCARHPQPATTAI